MAEVEEPWRIRSERVAKEILSAATRAHTEEDLKIRVEAILKQAFTRIGIDVEMVQYEKATGLRSRMDAVYGYLRIEYKKPGTLSRPQEFRKGVVQVDGYLKAEAARLGIPPEETPEKIIGILIDGEMISFHRYSKRARPFASPVPLPESKELFPDLERTTGIQSIGPVPIDDASIANLLIFARAAARRPLAPEDLASVFGPDQEVARRAISTFYARLVQGQRRSKPRIRAFFQEWDRIFGIVYGQSLEKAEAAAAKVARPYGLAGGIRLKPLLFSIHTYYALLMKLLVMELLGLQKDAQVESVVSELTAAADPKMRERLEWLERGAGFRERGIANFLEGDFFSWYLDQWDPEMAGVVRDIARALSGFEPATPVLQPEWTRDLLQKLYEAIVPRELRHDLGEFYTPRWLAGHLVDRSGYDGSTDKRFLDPACGSGTFLVHAIERAMRHAGKSAVELKALGESIQRNIVGFDINPMAVLASRTNYFLAMAPLTPHVRPITLPVYLCDAVVTPSRKTKAGEIDFKGTVPFPTTRATYHFPESRIGKEFIDWFTEKVEQSVAAGHSRTAFGKVIGGEQRLSEKELAQLVEVYGQIKDLADRDENGIWARYIRNGFAPLYLDKFDFVVGNPPWIRWGYLSDEYRKATLELWKHYGLFSLKGHEARLGAGEKDFSMLFTYACADHYLKPGGVLAFVITLEVFKSKGAGEGFRRLVLPDETPLGVFFMEDMVHLQPFATATNKTSIFGLRKGRRSEYPVPVTVWSRKKGTGRIDPDRSLDEVIESTSRTDVHAVPVDSKKPESSWQTSTRGAIKLSNRMKGKCPYRAYLGARVEPYGVFWLEIKEVRPDRKLVVKNLHDRGKRRIEPTTSAIEPELVYPAVAGGNITRFGIKDHFYVLLPQDPATRKGYDEEWLISKLPLTHGYLNVFKEVLIRRAAYQKYFHKEVRRGGRVVGREPIAPFYSMYNISEESFAPHRVAWKRMASRMEAVVLSRIRVPYGVKPVISTDTTSFFPTTDPQEAHYLCALLNSAPVDEFLRSFTAAGRGFGAPSVMKNVAIPKYSRRNAIHRRLARLSIEAHKSVKTGGGTADILKRIDAESEALWNTRP